MSKRYCPNCDAEIKKNCVMCPVCGEDITLDNGSDLLDEEKYFLDEEESNIDADSIPDISDDMPTLDDKELW